ncbi:phosphate ABC transporter substrate-binding protein PstS [Bradyrhizobium macuxiense]|uniref:phosphate ABC transporter substrate-binding protein PstS n=1 Tax=Bradyrhizobium macuxiense TaxID=1755647 RepID=UPI001FEF321A|nr:phosphate ABC transporter substrate-binding protein PstS [Bradyrhizobium macuxiense]
MAAETKGAGSTFVSPVMAKWIDAYKAKTGNNVSYQSVGSSIGVGLIKKAAVDFGTSDMPLDSKELDKLGMMQFPIVIGGVVPVVNIEGVKPGQIQFTGQLLADIYLGKIRSWNDPAIQAVNPDLKLPRTAITVVHRLDGSGTTFNWSNYLAKVSAQWKASIGEGTSVEWPVGLGGKGNDGVASLVSLIPGSIGYLEYAYALQRLDRISFGLVQNSAGNFVTPDAASFQAAAASADWTATQDFNLVLTNAPGEDAYPITATTFVLMHKQPKSPERSATAIDFLRWSLDSGKPQAQLLNYVPLPATLVEQIELYWQHNFEAVTASAAAPGKR